MKTLSIFVAVFLSLMVSNAKESTEFGKHVEKGHKVMLEHKFADALVEFDKAKKLLRGTQGVPPRLWFEMGRCHRALDEHEKAITCFQNAIDAKGFTGNSYSWRAKLKMALTLHDNGQTKKARELLDRYELELIDSNLERGYKDSRSKDLVAVRKKLEPLVEGSEMK